MKFKILLFLFLLAVNTTMFAQEIAVPEGRENNAVITLFFAGLKDKMAEDYVNASKNFTKVTALDTKNDAAYFELATINYRQNKLLDAEIAIKKAISLNATNIWYVKLHAEIYKRNGNMDALVLVFDQLIRMSPEEVGFYFDKANALSISGKTEDAQKVYEGIEQKFGTSKELAAAKQRLLVNKDGGANNIAEVEKIIQENPSDVKNYLYLSGVLLDKNKKEEAFVLLQKAKVLEPDNFEIDLAMADVFQAQNKNDLAIASLQSAFANNEMPVEGKIDIISKMLPKFKNKTLTKDATALVELAIKTHPNDMKLTLLYGDVLYQQGNLNGAATQYLALLKSSPQLYIAWEKVLGVQTLMGRYSEAIKTGEEALSIYPNQAILYYYLAFALHRNGQNAEANLELKSALLLESEDKNLSAMILALQAEVLIDQQKFKEADIAFDKAIALTPDNYLTLSNYAYYLALRNHNLTKAEMLASKSAMALPANASIADTYALVLFKLGKYDEALSWIQKALENNEAVNPVYLEHYGDILFMKGDLAGALTQWQKAQQSGNSAEKLKQKINEKKYIK
jgi:tetratricopeptide (TPR) repeat protein